MKRIAVAALLLATPLLAGGAAPRRFPLPAHGVFEIAVPADWQETVDRPDDDTPPTIRFHQRTGRPFEMLITPVWNVDARATQIDSAEVRRRVTERAQQLSSQAVEKSIEIHELKGVTGVGYWFMATDRAPKPDEYKYVTQGLMGVGSLAVTFTILTSDGQEGIAQAGIAAMKTAANKH